MSSTFSSVRAAYRDLIARTLENVEDMDVEALRAGIPWDFETSTSTWPPCVATATH
jgi:hypothetical protein